MRLVDIEPLFDKYDKMNEGTEFSPIHFMNDLAALPVVESCEDSVSKEDVLRILQKAYDESLFDGWNDYCTVCNWVKDLPSVKPQTVTDFADKCKECGKILNETYQQKWIPVSEEPKEQGSYITTIKYGDKYAVGQRYYHGKYVGWEDSCVMAYMPLPEPYKEDNNGE